MINRTYVNWIHNCFIFTVLATADAFVEIMLTTSVCCKMLPEKSHRQNQSDKGNSYCYSVWLEQSWTKTFRFCSFVTTRFSQSFCLCWLSRAAVPPQPQTCLHNTTMQLDLLKKCCLFADTQKFIPMATNSDMSAETVTMLHISELPVMSVSRQI